LAGKLVALQSNEGPNCGFNNVATSTDGITWTIQSMPVSDPCDKLDTVIFAANKFIVTKQYNGNVSGYNLNGRTVFTSTNGPGWTVNNNALPAITSTGAGTDNTRFDTRILAFGGGQIIAIFKYISDNFARQVLTGITWTGTLKTRYLGN
jgi:hypothetical protein